MIRGRKNICDVIIARGGVYKKSLSSSGMKGFWVLCLAVLFGVHSVLIHIVANFSSGFDDFAVRRVADVEEAYLVVLAIEPACSCLVAILEVVGADEVGVPECSLEVVCVELSSLVLVFGALEACVEKSAIECAEVEFSYEYGHVDSFGQGVVFHGVCVCVEADDVGVFSTGADRSFV